MKHSPGGFEGFFIWTIGLTYVLPSSQGILSCAGCEFVVWAHLGGEGEAANGELGQDDGEALRVLEA